MLRPQIQDTRLILQNRHITLFPIDYIELQLKTLCSIILAVYLLKIFSHAFISCNIMKIMNHPSLNKAENPGNNLGIFSQASMADYSIGAVEVLSK